MAKNIFLIGYMGAGKTTLGKMLAERLGMAFIDLDVYIEQHYHKTISQLFEERGENAFREIEKNALGEVAELENTIIATGGGTPCFFNNLKFMNNRGLTVYLQLPPEKLLCNLIEEKSKRPLIKDKTDEELLLFIEENLAKRAGFYSQAKLVVNPQNDVGEIVEKIKSVK